MIVYMMAIVTRLYNSILPLHVIETDQVDHTADSYVTKPQPDTNRGLCQLLFSLDHDGWKFEKEREHLLTLDHVNIEKCEYSASLRKVYLIESKLSNEVKT